MRFSTSWLLLATWLLASSALAAPKLDWQKLAEYPHRTHESGTGAFTQGLELDGDTLLESSGRYGLSYIARWSLDGSTPPQTTPISPRLFAEGLTRLGDRLYLLTWQDQRGLIFDAATLQQTGSFRYRGEGWGLTNDGTHLIMSDGSAELRFLDPQTLIESSRLTIRDNGEAVDWLNELEWLPAGAIDTEPRLLANLWQSDRILVIDPKTGVVTGEIDLGDLYPLRDGNVDVMNGIAWDRRDQTLLVTGKLWPSVYRLRLLPPSAPSTGN